MVRAIAFWRLSRTGVSPVKGPESKQLVIRGQCTGTLTRRGINWPIEITGIAALGINDHKSLVRVELGWKLNEASASFSPRPPAPTKSINRVTTRILFRLASTAVGSRPLSHSP